MTKTSNDTDDKDKNTLFFTFLPAGKTKNRKPAHVPDYVISKSAPGRAFSYLRQGPGSAWAGGRGGRGQAGAGGGGDGKPTFYI